ncbi:MAG: C1 family peptidase [Dehalococcoidia bacterium]
MRKLVGVAVVLAIFLALILSGCGLPPLPNETFQVAPVSPEFLEFWENRPEPFYGYIPPPMDLSHLDIIPVERAVGLTTMPSSFDWRAQGKVTPVKNQNPCGTCWVFGTTSVLESAVLIGENMQYDFSEQSVALCVDRSRVSVYDDSSDPCDAGGFPRLAAEVFIKKGAVLESCNPYNPAGLNCDGTCVCDGCSPIKKVNGYRLVTNDKSQTGLIKEAVYNQGPVTVSFYHDEAHEYTHLTYGTVYDCATCAAVNHGVSIIGWDDSVPHFETPGTGAWLVKNSWGTDSGNNGYLWLAYDSSCMVDIAYLQYKDYDPNEKLYYWDEAGLVLPIGCDAPSAWMASIFTSTQNGSLTHVDFWTTSNNARYEIYIYLDGNISDGLQNRATSQSGTCQEFGYYSIPLTLPVSLTNGQPFTIAVKITTPGFSRPIPIEISISEEGETMIDPPIQAGKSFARCSDSGAWQNLGEIEANACLRARVTSQYNLTISSTAGGSVTTPGEGTFTYGAGTVVSLVASPATGYRFVNWTGDVDGIADVDAAATTITMDDDYTITANFMIQYDLAIVSTTGGSVTNPGEGTFTYDEGTVVNLVAKAEQGYRFVNWTGDVDEIADVDAATTTITMDDDYAITANFMPQYDLAIVSTTGGSVTGPGEGTFPYDPGTVVNLVAEAEQGYRFVNWTGDVDEIADVDAAATTITMNDDYAISANFIARYDLTIDSTAGGSVTGPGEGTFTYDDGTVVNLIAEPEQGYRFVSWTGDVDEIADVQAATTTITIKGSSTITANFIARYDLSIVSTAGGSVTGPGEGTFTYDDGTAVNLVAQPDGGYRFVNWTGDVDDIADVQAATTTITIKGDSTITANFEEIPRYDLAVSSTAGGSVTGPGEGTFTYYDGTAVDLIAEPEEGYRFVIWTGDVDDIADVQAAATTITIKGKSTITAHFEEIPRYDLTISSAANGSVTGPGEGTFTYYEGTAVDLIAEPEQGYRLVNWTGDVDGIADVQAAATTITIMGNSTIIANFEEIPQYDLAVSSTAGGSVTGPGEGTFTYDDGTVVDLIARPEEGYGFVNWTGDVDDIADVQAATTTITIRGDSTISANFIVQYELTIDSTDGGSVSEPGEGTFACDEGTVVDLVAEAEEGYRFVNWTGDVDTVADAEDALTTITMEGDYSITANFRTAGGCFIATAAYGTPMAGEIEILREFRDGYLLTNPLGQAFVDFYYRTSPPVAQFITEHPSLKPVVRVGLLPAVVMSTAVVNTTPVEKTAIAGLVVLVSVALAIWAKRRRGGGSEYT